MKILKRTTFFFLVLLSFCSQTKAQNPLKGINDQLRSIFTPLNRPGMPPKEYLWDMSGHISDPKFWTNNNTTDVLNMDDWYRIYWETFYMAYDTVPIDPDDSIYSRVMQLENTIIPIGIRDIDYYYLMAGALTSSTYFNFDLVNNTISDVAGASSPYLIKDLFVAAPLYNSCDYNSVTFQVSPGWIFKDAANAIYYSGTPYTMEIDFGDGNGFITFDPTVTTNYDVTYTGDGDHEIITQLSVDGMPLKKSKSKITTLGKTRPSFAPASYTETPDGMTVSVYNHCDGISLPTTKIVIYLNGFDPFSNVPRLRRSADDIYEGMIKNPHLAELRNYGYEFRIISWNDAMADIRTNAMNLVNYMKNLTNTMMTLPTPNQNQFVVIGESMGGLVARYAMCYMESASYTTDPWNPYASRMHNTRLLITFDTPHQGATIPMAYQLFYDGLYPFMNFAAGMNFKYLAPFMRNIITSDAARQMLIYHCRTYVGNTFSCDPMRTTFLSDLASLGNYPVYCKKMALSNGVIDGKRQMEFYNTNQRNPNDNLFDINFNMYCQILWFIKVPLFNADAFLRTDPNGSGPIMHLGSGSYYPSINFFWFGVNLSWTYYSWINLSQNMDNAKPYTTGPGGFYSTTAGAGDLMEDIIGNSPSMTPWKFWSRGDAWFLVGLFFDYRSSTDAGGCWHGSAFIGLRGFSDVNFDLDMCSDGAHFCFIPLQSALDYGGGMNLDVDHNIEADGIATILSQTPFDVVVAEKAETRNRYHLHVRREYKSYPPCDDPQGHNVSYDGNFINQEIGDDKLYLDNWTLTYEADFEAVQNIFVNGSSFGIDYNDFYEYANFGNPARKEAMYSKSGAFDIPKPGKGNFTDPNSSFANTIPGPPVIYNAYYPPIPPRARRPHTTTTWLTCCIDMQNALRKNNGIPKGINEVKNYLKVYPVPVDNGKDLQLVFDLEKGENATLKIYDICGALVLDRTIAFTTGAINNYVLSVKEQELKPGVYFITLDNQYQSIRQKIIIE